MRSRLFALALTASLAIVIAACGGSNAAPATGAASSASGSNPAASAAVAASPEAAVEAAAEPGASAITLTGAMETSITEAALCGLDNIMGEDFKVAANTADDDFWMFRVIVNNFDRTGPDTYETGDNVGRASVKLTDGMGHSFDGDGDSGTVTIDDSLTSGSIEATITNTDTGETVTLSGTFACE
jgi:predicted dienelactone hydrolase